MTLPLQTTRIGDQHTACLWPNMVVTIDTHPAAKASAAEPMMTQPGRITVAPDSPGYGPAVLIALDIRPLDMGYGGSDSGASEGECRVVEVGGRNYIVTIRDYDRLLRVGVRFAVFTNTNGRIVAQHLNAAA